MKEFFKDSALSRKVKIPLRIVMMEQPMTPRQMAELRNRGELPLTTDQYQLEAGGEILGKGSIFEKEGKRFFKLMEEEVS